MMAASDHCTASAFDRTARFRRSASPMPRCWPAAPRPSRKSTDVPVFGTKATVLPMAVPRRGTRRAAAIECRQVEGHKALRPLDLRRDIAFGIGLQQDRPLVVRSGRQAHGAAPTSGRNGKVRSMQPSGGRYGGAFHPCSPAIRPHARFRPVADPSPRIRWPKPGAIAAPRHPHSVATPPSGGARPPEAAPPHLRHPVLSEKAAKCDNSVGKSRKRLYRCALEALTGAKDSGDRSDHLFQRDDRNRRRPAPSLCPAAGLGAVDAGRTAHLETGRGRGPVPPHRHHLRRLRRGRRSRPADPVRHVPARLRRRRMGASWKRASSSAPAP